MADLSSLILLRNDPTVAAELLQAAERGDVDAQYGIGLVYADGRGLPQDDVRAMFWLTRAHEQGDRDADILRRSIATRMTSDQFDQVALLLKSKKTLVQTKATQRSQQRSASRSN